MKKAILNATVLALLLAVSFGTVGDSMCEPERLKPDLEELHDLDQGPRTGIAPANDASNRNRLRGIIENCGWPSVDTVGRKAAMGAFLVLQHAPLDMQIEYMPVLKRAQENGDLIPGTMPYLQDRVLVRQGKPQIYCTQFSGSCQLYEISNTTKVDELREAAGLPPLEEYVEYCREQSND